MDKRRDKTPEDTRTHPYTFADKRIVPKPHDTVEVFKLNFVQPGFFTSQENLDYIAHRELGRGTVYEECPSHRGWWRVRMQRSGRDCYYRLDEFGYPTELIVPKQQPVAVAATSD